MTDNLFIVDQEYIQIGEDLQQWRDALIQAMAQTYTCLTTLCEQEKGQWVDELKKRLPGFYTAADDFSQKTEDLQTDCVSYLQEVDETDATVYGG